MRRQDGRDIAISCGHAKIDGDASALPPSGRADDVGKRQGFGNWRFKVGERAGDKRGRHRYGIAQTVAIAALERRARQASPVEFDDEPLDPPCPISVAWLNADAHRRQVRHWMKRIAFDQAPADLVTKGCGNTHRYPRYRFIHRSHHPIKDSAISRSRIKATLVVARCKSRHEKCRHDMQVRSESSLNEQESSFFKRTGLLDGHQPSSTVIHLSAGDQARHLNAAPPMISSSARADVTVCELLVLMQETRCVGPAPAGQDASARSS